MSYTDTRPVTGTRPASDTGTTTPPAYRRVLIPIQDAAQAAAAGLLPWGNVLVSALQALPAGWGRPPGRGMARAGGR